MLSTMSSRDSFDLPLQRILLLRFKDYLIFTKGFVEFLNVNHKISGNLKIAWASKRNSKKYMDVGLGRNIEKCCLALERLCKIYVGLGKKF